MSQRNLSPPTTYLRDHEGREIPKCDGVPSGCHGGPSASSNTFAVISAARFWMDEGWFVIATDMEGVGDGAGRAASYKLQVVVNLPQSNPSLTPCLDLQPTVMPSFLYPLAQRHFANHNTHLISFPPSVMADSTFSTQAENAIQLSLNVLQDTALAHLSFADLLDHFEIDSTVNWILEGDFQRVCQMNYCAGSQKSFDISKACCYV